MKAISFQWTADVEPWEAEAVVSTVAHIQEIMIVLGQRAGLSLAPAPLRPFGTWVIPNVPRGSPYSSSLWYVQQSLDEETGQVHGPRFIETVRNEPWQRAGPHYDVALLHFDLTERADRNVEGMGPPFVLSTFEPDLAAILSVNRLREIEERDARRVALRRLAINAFGHVLELPRAGRGEATTTVNGVLSCTNICAQRSATDAASLLELAREEDAARTIFCTHCTSDLLDHIVATHFHQN